MHAAQAMQSPIQPLRAINHIGITIPNLATASEWYIRVLGFREICKPWTIDRAENPDSILFKFYGAEVQKVNIGFLSSANGCGIEMFEFVDPQIAEQAGFKYLRGGVFHIAITDADPEALKARVLENGGTAIGQMVRPFEDEDDGACYVQDPWGNVLELITCSMEQMLANRT
jgi:catechol 2,3-dioxygenase-like lactoylglutathione lyase family enzyme